MFHFSRKRGNRRRQAETARRSLFERTYAAKNIDYDLSSSFSDESGTLRVTRSLDLSPSGYSPESSIRIGGSVVGEVEDLYRRLGLSGPEDFAIDVAEWEASLKSRLASDVLPPSRFINSDSLSFKPVSSNLASELPAESPAEAAVLSDEAGVRSPAAVESVLLEGTRVVKDKLEEISLSSSRDGLDDAGTRVTRLPVLTPSPPLASVLSPPPGWPLLVQSTSKPLPVDDRFKPVVEASALSEEISIRDGEPVEICLSSSERSRRLDGGIKGTRPPVLTPPPASLLSPPPIRRVLAPPPSWALPIQDRTSSTWDILRSMAPADETEEGGGRRSLDSEVSSEVEEEEEEEDECVQNGGAGEVLEKPLISAETTDGAGSFSTTNDDDSSSSTTEIVISPNLRLGKQIKSWMRGQLLGSGSFGTVYEGISDDGTFIAIKEVSLLDKGSNAQQCILQLEQEIALLSIFEHPNIVQYYGTSKEESKLLIFLELLELTQGSLASLYQKYHLRDTQVSAYTRQILNGLNYLHERNVVHRDIKCANILVHANGSVKLADFGLAKEISKFSDLKSCKGSVYWMAPEVVRPKKTYGSAADIWSLGCTVLELLTRQVPFPNDEWQRAFYKIGKGEQPPIPNHLSSEARDFIRKCVQVDPNARPTAAQLFDHPFIAKRPLEAFSR
ncbi:Mitogen-activated protein kinase kinase kinase 1 [Platanthera guangdongensis]|uniref:mitogen-activated protein kinase kinase kinase n=1 Tax=Platanthera guangdongensis TaxID=2320717 RepID=A0ABR2LJX2_9ASPA